MDEFVISGQKPGKRGRGAEDKNIVAAAVERCNQEKKIGRIRLHVILDFSSFSLGTFIHETVERRSIIFTDSLASYPPN